MKLMSRHRDSILGMAMPRHTVLQKLSNVSPQLNEHIIKCVVYHDVSPSTIPHWVTEIAAWLRYADRLKSKSQLKAVDYQNTLFGSFGDEKDDADINLTEFQLFNNEKRDDRYPDFEVTSDLITQLFQTYQNLMNACTPLLLSKDVHDLQEWRNTIMSSLN